MSLSILHLGNEIQLRDTLSSELIGSLNYSIDNGIAHLLYLEVYDEYKGKGYSYILLYNFATLLHNNEIKKIQLDDCSDNALNYPPSRTRSGRTWNCNNVYANIGCEAEEGYPSAERICKVDKAIKQLKRLLREKGLI